MPRLTEHHHARITDCARELLNSAVAPALVQTQRHGEEWRGGGVIVVCGTWGGRAAAGAAAQPDEEERSEEQRPSCWQRHDEYRHEGQAHGETP